MLLPWFGVEVVIRMLRYLLVGFAGLSFVGGVITFWLPIPLGVPLFLFSVPILMKYSPRWRRWLLHLGRIHPRVAQMLERFKPQGD